VTIVNFTPVTALIGGVMIGLSAWLLLAANGRVAGISGIFGGLLSRGSYATPGFGGDWAWRVLFLIGLVLGAAGHRAWVAPEQTIAVTGSIPLLIAGGLLVGFGTRLGGGCTSGHGVCGIGRLSKRSIAATLIFMIVAGLTVFVTRHLLGASS
jgi:uncharacterized membrane protein YedE/YeeE